MNYLGRQWNGFPSGIETLAFLRLHQPLEPVASGMASRQGLKHNLRHLRHSVVLESPVEWLPVRD